MLYSLMAYSTTLLTLPRFALFLGNVYLSHCVDYPVRSSILGAIVNNVLLMSLFGLQHSLMARTPFKKVLTRVIPVHVERSTYVLLSSIVLEVLIRFWQPVSPGLVLLRLPTIPAYTAFVFGWVLILMSATVISHTELFGLRQAWIHFIGDKYTHVPFVEPFLYRIVRHPLYLGWIFTFWSTPTLTLGRLLLASGLTLYLFIGIHYEERDLVKFHGENYEKYRAKTPKIIPYIH